MKKKLFAVLFALIVCIACVPLFSGCSVSCDYTLKTDGDGNKYYVVSCSGYRSKLEGEIVIPEYYGEGDNRAPVTEIAQEGFAGTSVSKVTIPKTVTKIGIAAFAYCYGLREAVFADGSLLTEIPRGTFGYCSSLEKVNIPDTVETLGVLSFMNCNTLTKVTLPSNLRTIETKAFYFAGLTEIAIPDSVSDIVNPDLDDNGEQKKDEDGNLLYTVTPAIGLAAFHSCMSLKTVKIGAGVTTIKSGTFGYCPELKEVYLPAGLECIEGAHYRDGSEESGKSDGSFYCGHAFHSDTALTDVYYAGTAESWTALTAKIDNKLVSYSGASFDNSAILNATLHIVK